MANKKLSFEEAEKVIKLWKRGATSSEGVDIDTLAATLGISREEVLALHSTASQTPPQSKLPRKFIDRSGVLSAMIAGGVAAVACLVFLGVMLVAHSAPDQNSQPVVISTRSEPAEPTTIQDAPPAPTATTPARPMRIISPAAPAPEVAPDPAVQHDTVVFNSTM